MTKPGKRSHGDGSIDSRGADVHRLRYRVDGKRSQKPFMAPLATPGRSCDG
jgi:integrase